MARRTSKETGRTIVGPNHAVVSMEGGAGYRRKPCEECPWKCENAGKEFPAEAFRRSAKTAYDMADTTFGCHMSEGEPVTCAGFLLAHSENNLAVRLRQARGQMDLDQVHDGGNEMFTSYRDMAIANGVDPDDPVLTPVRDNGEF